MKENKKVVIVQPIRNEMVKLVKTSYHYYRNWVKDILIEGGINIFKFSKDKKGYGGTILIPQNKLEEARIKLKKFKQENVDTVPLWW